MAHAKSIRVVTHGQIIKRGESIAVQIRSGFKRGGDGEPRIYIEISPEADPSSRYKFALDHTGLFEQFVLAELTPGSFYKISVTGTVEAPEATFAPLPETRVREVLASTGNARANGSLEDILTAVLGVSMCAIQRAEALTGLTMTQEAQALGTTVLIDSMRSGKPVVPPSEAERILGGGAGMTLIGSPVRRSS